MSCGAVEGIGAVIKSCGGCGRRPPRKRWVLAARIPVATMAQAGDQVSVGKYLTGLRQRDVIGRHAHVTGLWFSGDVDFTLADATTEAVPGYDMLGVWSQLFLRDVSGWIYWGGNVDGRNLNDDLFFRNYRGSTVFPRPTDIAADAGAGTLTRSIDMIVPLSRLDDEEGAGVVMGSIPLVALAARGDDALQFSVGTPRGNHPYTDVTFDGFSSDFIKIYVELIYLDGLYVDAPWALENYTIDETESQLRHPDREHEYLALRHLPEDTGGQSLADYDGITFEVEGDILISALSFAETAYRNSVVLSDVLETDGTDLYVATAGQTTAFLFLPRARTREESAAGKAAYNFTTRTTHTSTRFLHRTVACHFGERAAAIARAAECMTGSFVGVTHKGEVGTYQPTMPIAVYPPNVNAQIGGDALAPFSNPVRGA